MIGLLPLKAFAVGVTMLASVVGLLGQGLDLYSQKKYLEAVDKFSRIINEFENNNYTDDARYWRGMCYVNTGKKAEALADFEAMQLTFPESDYYLEAEKQISKINGWDKGQLDRRRPDYTWKSFQRMLLSREYKNAYKCFDAKFRDMIFIDYNDFVKQIEPKREALTGMRLRKIKTEGIFARLTVGDGSFNEVIYLKKNGDLWFFVDAAPNIDSGKSLESIRIK